MRAAFVVVQLLRCEEDLNLLLLFESIDKNWIITIDDYRQYFYVLSPTLLKLNFLASFLPISFILTFTF